MASSLQAARLCEMVLEQGPWCAWVLRRDGAIERAWGDSLPYLGVAASCLTGRNFLDLATPGSRPLWRERLRRVFAGETISLRERGAAGLFSVTCHPLRVDGEIAYAAVAAADSTLRDDAERQVREVALKVLKAGDDERTRLARFLHDELGQCLSAAGLQLDLLRMDMEGVAPDLPARTAEIQQVLERVMERVRDVSRELNPEVVEPAGLYAALDGMVGRARRDFAGTLRLMADSSLRLEHAPAKALYRIACHAVDNAIRHSHCTVLEVHFKATRLGPALEVRDNGQGFYPTDAAGIPAKGLGLLIMEHYAAETGIDLAVTSRPGCGTTVRAVLRTPSPKGKSA